MKIITSNWKQKTVPIWWLFKKNLIDCRVDNWQNFKQYLIKWIINLIENYLGHVSSDKHEHEYDKPLIYAPHFSGCWMH